MIYILSGVLCLAVAVMLAYHLSLIAYGETSVESQDNEVYLRHAKQRNEVFSISLQVIVYHIQFFLKEFVNSYDCGLVIAIALQKSP